MVWMVSEASIRWFQTGIKAIADWVSLENKNRI